MSREEAEQKIAEKLKEIKAVMDEYGAVSGYLSLSILGNTVMFNNSCWNNNEYDVGRDYSANKVLDYWERV